jgi:hypothetical protein
MASVSRKVLKELAESARKNAEKLVKPLPDNVTSKSNVVKTINLRIDVHQSSTDPNKAVAKVQANAEATDKTVQNYINSGSKGGSGSHRGTHKNIVEIQFDREAFDVEDFARQIEDAS